MSIIKKSIFLSILFFSASAYAVVDNQAQTVQLKTSCTMNEVAIDNCFETTAALRNWMRDTRHPNVSAPLEVEMGPGKFGRLGMVCDPTNGYTGHVSFNGAGPDQSSFVFSAGGSPPYGVLTIKNCTALAFNDLKVSSGTSGFAYGYIQWQGGGTSRWSNVDVVVSARGWEESSCAATKGEHYWFGSRYTTHVVAGIGKGYTATCDDSWFYGSEITFTTAKLGQYGLDSASGAFYTLAAANGAEIHVYGSAIRALSPASGTTTGTMTAVTSTGDSKVHLHGTGIDVVAKDNKNAIALSASSGGVIHANQSSYFMTAAVGTVTRIANNDGIVRAPYLWETDVLTLGNAFSSQDGSDQTTEVVCESSICMPHTMVYTSQSTANRPWYDTVTNACRQ